VSIHQRINDRLARRPVLSNIVFWGFFIAVGLAIWFGLGL
jgi:hypothetical protein